MATLFHFHDPMCSWCWAFKPTWATLQAALPDSVNVTRVLGGLAPDSAEPMPDAMKTAISGYWRHIEVAVPGTRFNHDFWTRCTPRRSTYPACRAVATARRLDPDKEETLNTRIQNAYYGEARNPSDDSTLIDLAVDVGFEKEPFTAALHSAETHSLFEADLQRCMQFGVQGFPSLVLQTEDKLWNIRIDYNDAQVSLSDIRQALENSAEKSA